VDWPGAKTATTLPLPPCTYTPEKLEQIITEI
jgi:hypothetical protein